MVQLFRTIYTRNIELTSYLNLCNSLLSLPLRNIISGNEFQSSMAAIGNDRFARFRDLRDRYSTIGRDGDCLDVPGISYRNLCPYALPWEVGYPARGTWHRNTSACRDRTGSQLFYGGKDCREECPAQAYALLYAELCQGTEGSYPLLQTKQSSRSP